jgi:hypothetical protein
MSYEQEVPKVSKIQSELKLGDVKKAIWRDTSIRQNKRKLRVCLEIKRREDFATLGTLGTFTRQIYGGSNFRHFHLGGLIAR